MTAHLVPDAAPTVPLRTAVRRFWPYARPRRGLLLVALLLAMVEPALMTVEIWLFKIVVDDVLLPRDFALFWWVAAGYVGLTLIQGALAGISRLLDTWLTQRFLIDVRTDLLRHLQRLPLEFHASRRQGDVQSRITHDVSAIESFLVSGTTATLAYLLEVVFFTAALFVLDPRLAALALVVTPLFWFLTRAFSRRIRRISREKQRRVGAGNTSLEQTLSTIALVQAYDRADAEIDRYAEQAEAKYAAEMAGARVRSLFAPALELVELGGVLVVLGAGVWLISAGELTVGALLAFLTYLTRLYSPIRGVGSQITAAHSAMAGAERVLELLDEPPEPADGPDAVAAGTLRGRIEFRDVTVHHPGRALPALSKVSFGVDPGQVVAVVGPSGAGKSTMARLLVRSLDPAVGQVLLDGHDVRELTRASVRANVTLLLQQTQLVQGSIAENIRYGRPDASLAEVCRAADAAGVLDFAAEFPHGLDTEVGEKGRRLSGGQAQRVAIARALLRDTPVLVLDEPTVGLDRVAADRLQPALRRLMAGRTVLLITHDPDQVRQADRVLMLEAGVLVGDSAEVRV